MFKKIIKTIGSKILDSLDVIRDFKEIDLDHKEVEDELLSNQKTTESVNDILDVGRLMAEPEKELVIREFKKDEAETSIHEEISSAKSEDDLIIKVNQKIIKDFLDSYIGSIITKINLYTKKGTLKVKDSIFDIAEGKIISKIETIDTRANLYLSELGNAKHACILEIKYGLTGSFEESDVVEQPTANVVYRIETYGGESLDYIDTNVKNSIKVII